MSHESSDEDREMVRQLFDRDWAPKDIVPGSGLTREVLLAQNAATGTWSEVFVPGEVIHDVDGLPIGMTESSTSGVYFGGTVVLRSQLDTLGLTPKDVPNLHVMDDPTPKEKR